MSPIPPPYPQIAKYQVFKNDGGQIPPDEPVFVLRAKDIFALAAVSYYGNMVHGTVSPEMEHELHSHFLRMRAWREQNRDRLHIPD